MVRRRTLSYKRILGATRRRGRLVTVKRHIKNNTVRSKRKSKHVSLEGWGSPRARMRERLKRRQRIRRAMSISNSRKYLKRQLRHVKRNISNVKRIIKRLKNVRPSSPRARRMANKKSANMLSYKSKMLSRARRIQGRLKAKY